MAEPAERLDDESRIFDDLAHGSLGVRKNIVLSRDGLGTQARRLFRHPAILETPDFDPWARPACSARGVDKAEEVLDSADEVEVNARGVFLARMDFAGHHFEGCRDESCR